MLGDGDPHALQELMVEVGDVVFAELVSGEEEGELVDEVGVKVGVGEPRVPIHGFMEWWKKREAVEEEARR